MGDGLGSESALALVRVILDQTRQMRRLSGDLAGVNVVWMRVFPIVSKNSAGLVHANLAYHSDAGFFSQPYMAVGQLEVIANGEAHFLGGSRRFARACLPPPPGPHSSPP